MSDVNEAELHLAQAVRDACIAAAKEGYERAAMSGLCEDGALEAALSAICVLDLDAVLEDIRVHRR